MTPHLELMLVLIGSKEISRVQVIYINFILPLIGNHLGNLEINHKRIEFIYHKDYLGLVRSLKHFDIQRSTDIIFEYQIYLVFYYTITLSEEEILSSDVTQSMVIMKGACPPVKYGKHAICQLEKYLECTDLNACFILPRTCIYFHNYVTCNYRNTERRICFVRKIKTPI